MSDAAFRLPAPPRFETVEDALRATKDLRGALGVYEPGRAPLLFNAAQTEDPTSLATLAHEEAHQRLSLNTGFGLLHQILARAARKGKYGREYAMSIEAQWCVQELCATYAEFYTICVKAPKRLGVALERLPSEALGEAPYREVLEYMAQHLPIDPDLGATRLGAQNVLVSILGACSLSNDCLSTFADATSMTPTRFAEYLQRESPTLRFERILARLVGTGRLGTLVEELTPYVEQMRSGAGGDEAGPFAAVQIASAVEVHVDRRELRPLFEKLLRGWHAVGPFGIQSQLDGLVPELRDHPGAIDAGLKRIRESSTLGDDNFLRCLESVAATGEGLVLQLAINDTSEAHVYLNTYATKDRPLPNPDIPADYNGRDWSGLVSTEVLVDGLEQYPDLVDVVQLVGESWLRWLAIAGGRPIAPKAVRVCVESELSTELVESLLEFDGICACPRYFFVGRDGRPEWAWILNPDKVGHYLRFKTDDGSGTTIFLRIMEALGIEPLPPNAKLEQRSLLSMLSFKIPY